MVNFDMSETAVNASKLTRILDIEGAINFRDLGGYPTNDGRQVRWGKVFRSAQLDRLTENGVKELADLGIKAVVDLRFDEESRRYPTVRRAVPNAEMLAWNDPQFADAEHQGRAMQMSWKDSLDSNDPAQVREAMRVNYPKKLYSHRLIYRAMLQRLIDQQTPLVFHCAAGKDRTGVAAALILSLLGVSDEVIIEDYLITQRAMQHLIENWVAGGATDNDEYEDFQSRLAKYPKAIVRPIFDADEAYIRTLLDYVNENYNGFENYALTKLELQHDDLELLRARLLV